ncbi:MAG TPA: hypothetical protein VN626_09510 [Clostridia bacterium]|nr:hypothetical protein [Clostridia bacterium]
MKKTLALGLAAAMMLSMGAAVSAKDTDALYPVGAISDSAYLYSSDASAVDLATPVESVAYGKTLYYPLLNNSTDEANTFNYVYESEAVSGIKVKADWDMNGKLVKSLEVTKKKITGETLSQKYIYFLAINLAESTSTSAVDVVGTVEMRKSGSFDYEDMQLDVNMEVAYPVASDTIITEDLQIFKEGYGFIGDSEEEFSFECDDDSYFTVNTVGQSKLLISASTDFDSKIADLYSTANLNFFYGNGATFNKTGVLTLAADEGSYLYQLKDDGNMVRLNAEYDEYDEAFLIKTKTLGKYIVSDTALTIVNVPENNGGTTTPTNPSNPSTGAAL